MKKADLFIIFGGLFIMLVLFVGYRIVVHLAGDERMVEVRFNGQSIYSKEITNDLNVELLVIDGKVIETIDRNEDKDREFDLSNVSSKVEYNIVKIFDNGIQVIEANCPSQDDVHKGFTDLPYDVILCLPHRLEVEILPLNIENNPPIDGEV